MHYCVLHTKKAQHDEEEQKKDEPAIKKFPIVQTEGNRNIE